MIFVTNNTLSIHTIISHITIHITLLIADESNGDYSSSTEIKIKTIVFWVKGGPVFVEVRFDGLQTKIFDLLADGTISVVSFSTAVVVVSYRSHNLFPLQTHRIKPLHKMGAILIEMEAIALPAMQLDNLC